MKLSEKYEKMTALAVVWRLLWDRRYGPRIQERLRNGGYLDDDFIFEIKRQAIMELQRCEARQAEHVHIHLVHA
jgi:predicted patatin/cPLA2 family phospholipase